MFPVTRLHMYRHDVTYQMERFGRWQSWILKRRTFTTSPSLRTIEERRVCHPLRNCGLLLLTPMMPFLTFPRQSTQLK